MTHVQGFVDQMQGDLSQIPYPHADVNNDLLGTHSTTVTEKKHVRH